MRRFALLLVLLLCCVSTSHASRYASPPPSQTTPGASTNNLANLQLNGTAKYLADGAVRLTEDSINQAGSVFAVSPVPITHFDTSFSFLMTGPAVHADGLTFCIQSDPSESRALGSIGGYLGYGYSEPWNTPGVTRSVAIEFDDYYNDTFSDLASDHVGIDVSGSVISHAQAASPVPLTSGTISARIIYAHGYLSVYLWSAGGTQPRRPLLNCRVDIPAALGSKTGFVGFTSATATYFQYTDVLEWAFNTADYVPAPIQVVE